MPPQRWQPTRLPHPWDSPGKNTGVGCHFLLQYSAVKRSRFESVLMRWMKLEPIMQSEVSQKEKHIYMEFREMVTMTLYTRQQKRHRCKEQIFWTMWEKARVGWFERIALKRVYYHMWNRWPVQVQCMKQGTQSWCPGTTQRDGMASEVGGGFGMGDTCTPMADSCQCMAKSTTIL